MRAESITNLVKDYKISLNAASILAALQKTDLVEEAEYVSTSGSGELKTFLRLTEKGLKFGQNKHDGHPIKTAARFYSETFPELIEYILPEFQRELEAMRRDRDAAFSRPS